MHHEVAYSGRCVLSLWLRNEQDGWGWQQVGCKLTETFISNNTCVSLDFCKCTRPCQRAQHQRVLAAVRLFFLATLHPAWHCTCITDNQYDCFFFKLLFRNVEKWIWYLWLINLRELTDFLQASIPCLRLKTTLLFIVQGYIAEYSPRKNSGDPGHLADVTSQQ